MPTARADGETEGRARRPGRAELGIAVALASVAALGMMARASSWGLVDWDTYPQIETSRIESFADLLGTFTEETADGYYPFAFYRPVFNLLVALGYAVGGMDPIGYHAIGALLYLGSAVSMFWLTRVLLGPGARVGPWLCLLAFLLLPVQVEVVPLSSRHMDLACGLFSALALGSAAAQLRRSRSRVAWFPALFTLLAVGAKELGAFLPALVFFCALCLGTDRSRGERWRRAGLAALPHVTAVGIAFAARFAALGELGGHPSTRVLGMIDRLPFMLGTMVFRGGSLAPANGNLVAPALQWIATGGVLVALATASAPIWRRAPWPVGGAGEGPRARATVAVGLAWLLLVAAMHGITGLAQPWHLLAPGQALALTASGLAESSWARIRRAGASGRAAAGLVLALLAAWVVWMGAWSPLFHPYTQWARATGIADDYLGSLRSGILGSRPGAEFVAPIPRYIIPADPSPAGTIVVPVLSVYSIAAWARLVIPERPVYVDHEIMTLVPRGRVPPEPGAVRIRFAAGAAPTRSRDRIPADALPRNGARSR